MTRQEFKAKLVSKGFVFINKLKQNIGLSKKGSKSKDIEQILEVFDTDEQKVLSAFETLEMTRQNRFAKIKEVFSEIKESWETLVEHVMENDNAPENIKNIIEKIDNVIDFFFGK